MNSLKLQGFLVQLRLLAVPLEFPCADVGEVSVITHGFAVRELMFNPEMTAARLFAVQGVASEQFAEFEEVGHAAGVFQLLVEFGTAAADLDVIPEIFANLGDNLDGLGETLFGTGHTDVVPHDLAQFTVKLGNGLFAVD